MIEVTIAGRSRRQLDAMEARLRLVFDVEYGTQTCAPREGERRIRRRLRVHPPAADPDPADKGQ